jgi:hypothetical protein
MKKNIVFIAIGLLSSLGLRAQNWPAQTVHCTAVPTAIVDVTNPITGKTWMDRNLGASQVATSSNDALAYGDLYQWGRRADGHQCRTSSTTPTLSSVDQPTHDDFILDPATPGNPGNWRSPENVNLWQGINGVNNPCPSGYRVPTQSEFDVEKATWSTNNLAGGFGSTLKLNASGGRGSSGGIGQAGTAGSYWTSTTSGVNYSQPLVLSSTNASYDPTEGRVVGRSVRCIKDNSGTTSISSPTFNTIGFKLYPNPVVNILNVSIDSKLIDQSYTITDVSGKVLLKGKLNGVESTINVEQLSKGIYYLKIAGNSSSKFIKQ